MPNNSIQYGSPQYWNAVNQISDMASQMGANPALAASIPGFGYWESDGFNPTSVGDGGTSHGLMQVGSGLWNQMGQNQVQGSLPGQAWNYLNEIQTNYPQLWNQLQGAQSPADVFNVLRSTGPRQFALGSGTQGPGVALANEIWDNNYLNQDQQAGMNLLAQDQGPTSQNAQYSSNLPYSASQVSFDPWSNLPVNSSTPGPDWQTGAAQLPGPDWQTGAANLGPDWQTGAATLPGPDWQTGAATLPGGGPDWQTGAGILPSEGLTVSNPSPNESMLPDWAVSANPSPNESMLPEWAANYMPDLSNPTPNESMLPGDILGSGVSYPAQMAQSNDPVGPQTNLYGQPITDNSGNFLPPSQQGGPGGSGFLNELGGLFGSLGSAAGPDLSSGGLPMGSFTPDAVASGQPLAGSTYNLGGSGGSLDGGFGNAISDTLARHMLQSGQIQAGSVGGPQFFSMPGATFDSPGQSINSADMSALSAFMQGGGGAPVGFNPGNINGLLHSGQQIHPG